MNGIAKRVTTRLLDGSKESGQETHFGSKERKRSNFPVYHSSLSLSFDKQHADDESIILLLSLSLPFSIHLQQASSLSSFVALHQQTMIFPQQFLFSFTIFLSPSISSSLSPSISSSLSPFQFLSLSLSLNFPLTSSLLDTRLKSSCK